MCHDMNVEIIGQFQVLVSTIHIFRTKSLSFFYSFQECPHLHLPFCHKSTEVTDACESEPSFYMDCEGSNLGLNIFVTSSLFPNSYH